ncbi:MAG TPA: protein kinase [Gemmatimonadaceae bacterium]|nr:protein kinase [Gemmatimonadaceae bacterium]
MALRDQLQDALGTSYTITRELGGGGMSRVFVAREEALRRNVVVKVLPPDLLAGVNAERFDREIELAAGLQHPHIVPVLTAGQMDGVPYYTMPFVDGESLRARLTVQGALPMTEVIGVLRDVAKALAYAHERGIVHRDIKPDNVLLSGGSAVVTDFGIAKALSAARTAPGGTLTQIGTSIGTPAYMSPEQAAADPATDHRADIYSFGCLAYEMIAGRPPFVAKSPQKLLAAQMGETPQPVVELRPDVPSSLAQLVMKCLAKDADDRPQRAADIVRVLETVTSGTGHEAMPMILASGRGMFRKAMLLYVLAFVIVAVVAKAAIVAVGLPDWVFPGALIVMALGLPVILFTAYVHRTTRRVMGVTPTYTPGGTPSLARGTMAQMAIKASPHLSWRRAAIGGAAAVAAFVLLVGAYMVLRALGIGPAGSLLAQGALAQDEKILVADIVSPAGDSTLGPVVTDAFRTALGQSQSVAVVQQSTVSEVLRRMERPATSRIDFGLAREIATREGIKAVIDGSLLGVGGRYVLALRLVSAQTGDELASFRETAASQSELLPVVDRLAKEVRAKIGESLRNVQSAPPLEQVTTSSLEALKKYVQGVKVIGEEGDFQRGVALLQEAVTIDTAFAMAYRKLGVENGNHGFVDRAVTYYEKAYQHRDRLSDAERYLLLGSYYQFGKHADRAKARAAYEQLLDLQPTNTAGLNNLANEYLYDHAYARAESLLSVAVRVGPVAPVHFLNLARARFALGRPDSALAVADACVAAFPKNLECEALRARVFWATGRYDSTAAIVDRVSPRATQPGDRIQLLASRANLARLHGRPGEAARYAAQEAAAREQLGDSGGALEAKLARAVDLAWTLGDGAQAEQVARDALSAQPIDRIPVSEAPYLSLMLIHALAGEADQARGVLVQWDARRRESPIFTDSTTNHLMRGGVAFAEHRYAEAAKEFRAADTWECTICGAVLEGRARELAADTTGAITAYERFLSTPVLDRVSLDATLLPPVHERLGTLYGARGERAKALAHDRTFVALWNNADPELQPRVAAARKRTTVNGER